MSYIYIFNYIVKEKMERLEYLLKGGRNEEGI
jgi:hypothetical protein